MSEAPFMIKLEHVKEHENGDATYTFDMSETARDAILEDGLKLMLYCGVAKVDLQDVYDWILSHIPQEEELCPSCREPYDHPSGDGCAIMTKHSIREFDESERKRALERNNKNKSS